MKWSNIILLLVLLCLGNVIMLKAEKNRNVTSIRVGIYENYPKIFMNEEGKPDGIFIVVVEYIAKNENWEIEYVPGDWAELKRLLRENKIDVLPDVGYSVKRDSIFSLNSLSVLGSWIEVFTTDHTEIHSVLDLQDKRIGVLEGSIQEEYLNHDVKEKFNLTFEVISFNDYSSTVSALNENRVDAIVASRFFYFSDLCKKEILPTGVILNPNELYFAFPKNIHPEIIKLFDKHISELKNNPESVYYLSLQKFLDKRYITVIPRSIIWLVLIMSFISMIVLFFVVILRYKVKIKTNELRVKNKELIIAKEKAEESNRLKTVFLQNISHEIRTPMNGIIGFLSLMKNVKTNEEDRNHYLDIVNKSGQRLMNTVSDIIEMAKIETRQITVRKTDVNLFEVMHFHFNSFKEQAQEKGLELKLSKVIQLENAVIEADKYLIDCVLSNLLNNAIKFTDKGTVEFGNYPTKSAIVFYVKDTGIGIPEDKLESIFERFVHADLDISRPFEGTGLGLSIAKAYVSLLNGTIWVESKVNSGTTFFFSLPFTSAKKRSKKQFQRNIPPDASK